MKLCRSKEQLRRAPKTNIKNAYLTAYRQLEDAFLINEND